MPRNSGKRGPYSKNHSIRCVWCDDAFETTHEKATTCSQTCRSRLKRFRDWTGLEPEHPPGHVTAKFAYLDLIKQLLAAERRRRTYATTLANTPYHKRDAMERELDAAEAERRRRK